MKPDVSRLVVVLPTDVEVYAPPVGVRTVVDAVASELSLFGSKKGPFDVRRGWDENYDG